MNEYYYGLPQRIWDDLCFEAEDLLYNEKLGNHLVGLYPAGTRIYGIDSSPPGLLGLYVDSIESILDPFYEAKIYEYNVGHAMSPIVMIELQHWIRMIHKIGPNALIPCFHKDVIHQDESISSLIEAARKSLIAFGYPEQTGRKDTGNWLFARAKYILLKTGRFCPLVNPDWGEVISLNSITNNKELLESDEYLIEEAITNKTLDIREVVDYIKTLQTEFGAFTSEGLATTQECLQSKKVLSQEVINFYRFML